CAGGFWDPPLPQGRGKVVPVERPQKGRRSCAETVRTAPLKP
ncbi:MAG: hypothetical protein AVDCRST_MAG03-2219, partial [uncultured Rubrobacteraceae bacterium]